MVPRVLRLRHAENGPKYGVENVHEKVAPRAYLAVSLPFDVDKTLKHGV